MRQGPVDPGRRDVRLGHPRLEAADLDRPVPGRPGPHRRAGAGGQRGGRDERHQQGGEEGPRAPSSGHRGTVATGRRGRVLPGPAGLAGLGRAVLPATARAGPTTSRSPSCWSAAGAEVEPRWSTSRTGPGRVAGGAGALRRTSYLAGTPRTRKVRAVDAARRAAPSSPRTRGRAPARRPRRRRSARGCWRRWPRSSPRRATRRRRSPTPCRVARVSRGTFYALFASKEQCFLEAYRHGVDVLRRAHPRGRRAPTGRRLARAAARRPCAPTCDDARRRAALRPRPTCSRSTSPARRARRARRGAAALRRALPARPSSARAASAPTPAALRRRALRPRRRRRPARRARACASGDADAPGRARGPTLHRLRIAFLAGAAPPTRPPTRRS